jgi:hypothetical protein
MNYRVDLWAIIGMFVACVVGQAQSPSPTRGFNGLNSGMSNLHRLSNAETRSISAENPTGEKGKAGMAVEGFNKNAARELGRGWKVSPCVGIKATSTDRAPSNRFG